MARVPDWFKELLPTKTPKNSSVEHLLGELQLNTVCQSARCPNIGHCFDNGTATFMIMGDICSRNCGFCAVKSGAPGPLESDEAARIVAAVKKIGIHHAVITSVTRDDLLDGGAAHFAAVITALKQVAPPPTIEVLTPDFKGSTAALMTVLASGPDIFNHNLETVPALYSKVRPQASYLRSLDILKYAKENFPEVHTKSGIMLGLGESKSEVEQVLADLRHVGCDIVTIGQYLRPSSRNLSVKRYVKPAEFAEYYQICQRLGFQHIQSAPLVRSSFHAHKALETDPE